MTTETAAGSAVPLPSSESEAAAWLLTPEAIRARCGALLTLCEADRLEHFALDRDRLPATARYVAEEIRRNYPDLAVPYHSRWRHFAAGGIDRWKALQAALGDADVRERARIGVDLAVTSVLLDAGAGGRWRYAEPASGRIFNRSEGLAVASFHLFADGGFAESAERPQRADASALGRFDAGALAAAFQAGPDNPLEGLEGRARLLRALGEALAREPALFGAEAPRVGNLVDFLAGKAPRGRLPAREILAAVLRGFGPIWPGRIRLGGVALGDVWRHSQSRASDPSDRLVPLHKLSQWLAYSLIEPLEWAGLTVTGLEALTGLAEYRNGGLLVDLGVLLPRHPGVTGEAHAPGDEAVVEWRALTLALLDRLAPLVRAELGVEAEAFPLARMLEGGSWSAGRRIAAERRPDGGPPIRIVSDGTVF